MGKGAGCGACRVLTRDQMRIHSSLDIGSRNCGCIISTAVRKRMAERLPGFDRETKTHTLRR